MITRHKAEQLLTSLVNLRFAEEGETGRYPAKKSRDIIQRLRSQTEAYWPDLWGWVDDESKSRGEDRAIEILRKVRWYLQQFWASSDPYSKDWYLHRLRELHHRHLIQPETKQDREELNAATTADDARDASSWLNLQTEKALDQPPRRTAFEESLFHLQRIADKVRCCKNLACSFMPYFIEEPESKNAGYCCDDCRNAGRRESKRRWWSDNRAKKKGQKR